MGWDWDKVKDGRGLGQGSGEGWDWGGMGLDWDGDGIGMGWDGDKVKDGMGVGQGSGEEWDWDGIGIKSRMEGDWDRDQERDGGVGIEMEWDWDRDQERDGGVGIEYKGVKKGGVTENASYYIFTQCPDGAFEAFPVQHWYNFTPLAKHRTLTAEEAEEEWERTVGRDRRDVLEPGDTPELRGVLGTPQSLRGHPKVPAPPPSLRGHLR
uniref:Transcription initiation factor IIF subunit alpha n=1 Tax=Bubo bubo TaxID=30461 RepID=A0A8C0IEH0_BUBBB